MLNVLPFSSLGLVQLGQVYVDLREFEKAYQIFERLTKIRPLSELPRTNMALMLCYELGREKEGILEFKKVLENFPKKSWLVQFHQSF